MVKGYLRKKDAKYMHICSNVPQNAKLFVTVYFPGAKLNVYES